MIYMQSPQYLLHELAGITKKAKLSIIYIPLWSIFTHMPSIYANLLKQKEAFT